jgi:glycosyltransferase involved in cell wall biosynthesis
VAKHLRIAQVAPPFFPIPPDKYGGIEMIVAMLVDGLVARGHDVTLIAAGDPPPRGNFEATFDKPQRAGLGDSLVELTHAARAAAVLDNLELDVIHDHTLSGAAMARGRKAPVVITSHGPATGGWGQYLDAVAAAVHLVAISESQMKLNPELPWRTVIHNAVDTTQIKVTEKKSDHLVWMGRMCEEKGAHVAIDVARAAGRSIVLAAKCFEPAEQEYFEKFVQPRLGDDVDWRGEVGGAEKYRMLGEAAGFLFPLQWEEPFGLAMAEALACGTPVLALRRGAVPEIVQDGVTGYVRDTTEELAAAVRHLDRLDPFACRFRVDEYFSPKLMVDRYELLFQQVAAAQ